MPLAMNAAIRWLADSVRGRAGAWTDSGTRLRVLAIAANFFVGSVCGLVVEFRQPQWQLHFVNILIDVVCAVSGVGLFYRRKAAYMIVFVATLISAILGAAAVVWVPVLALVAWDIKIATPVDPAIIAYTTIVVGLGALAAGVWRFSDLYERLSRFRDRFASPLYGLVVAGAVLGIAWSIVNAVAPLLVTGWLSTTAVDPDVRLALFSIVLFLMMAFIMWSYATLRSRAVRDAFDLP